MSSTSMIRRSRCVCILVCLSCIALTGVLVVAGPPQSESFWTQVQTVAQELPDDDKDNSTTGKWVPSKVSFDTGVQIVTRTNTTHKGPDDTDMLPEGGTQVTSVANDPIHIALCSDNPDFRPLVVCIRSAVASSCTPHRLVFHFISTEVLTSRFAKMAKVHLQGILVFVHHNYELETHIRSLISDQKLDGVRRGLHSAFNFAPFYLPEFIGEPLKRIIYIDTDAVVRGDILELHTLDLGGRPCGAVKNCAQQMQTYINVALINHKGWGRFKKTDCIANRGVLVVDVAVWQANNLTWQIEQWLHRQKKVLNNSVSLWISGMSQPPWLLAMDGNFADIGTRWNCNGLGRSVMRSEEAESLWSDGLTEGTLGELDARRVVGGGVSPWVSTCSGTAKLLHFNGPVKPWLLAGLQERQRLSRCEVPRALLLSNHSWKTLRLARALGRVFVDCHEMWSMFSSPLQSVHDVEATISDRTDRHILEGELLAMGVNNKL